MSESLQQQRKALRLEMRARRRALTPSQQQQAATDVVLQAQQFAPLKQAQRVAIFLAMDGELNSRPLIEWLWRSGRQVYLPRIHPFAQAALIFQRYLPETPLVKHPLGMWEPRADVRAIIPSQQLDLILVPLVAFDAQGERLGMGGGFYDRLLADWPQRSWRAVGLAHDCQFVERLPKAAWDVPLAAAITPQRLWCWR